MNMPEPFEPWGEHLKVSLPGAQAVFTTRRGGFSGGPFASLNLGRLTSDRPELVERNRDRLAGLVGSPLEMVRQVHGSTVRLVEDDAPGAPLQEGDGVLTVRAGLAPAVLVADCLPVAVAGDGAVAMLHAGWRGLAAGILEAGVRAIRQLGVTGPLEAAIGPGVGACCYDVGEEVHEVFASYGGDVSDGRRLDLRAIARHQIRRAGVEELHDLDLCTSCCPDLFFSHRRDRGITGRQAGVAWLT